MKFIKKWLHNRRLKKLLSEKILLEAKLERAKAEVALYDLQLLNVALKLEGMKYGL